jgi:hypothetical protein
MEKDIFSMWGNFSLLDDEKEGVSLDADDLNPLVHRGKSCLVGKLLVDRIVPKEIFKAPLIRAWKPTGSVSFRVLGDNMFVADFEHDWDKARILEGRLWLFDGNLVSLADYNGITPPSQMDFEKAAFWVRMYNLPLACMGKEVGHKIGASVGKVVDVDIIDDEVGWGEYLRVKILLDLSKPLARGWKLHLLGKSVWISFKYEKIPKFCFSCGVVRHEPKGCTQYVPRRNPSAQGENPYGPWLRVSFYSRKFCYGEEKNGGVLEGMNAANPVVGELSPFRHKFWGRSGVPLRATSGGDYVDTNPSSVREEEMIPSMEIGKSLRKEAGKGDTLRENNSETCISLVMDIQDSREFSIGKDLSPSQPAVGLVLEDSSEGVLGKLQTKFVGSWDSNLDWMSWQKVDVGKNEIQLERDPFSFSFFPHVVEKVTDSVGMCNKSSPERPQPVPHLEQAVQDFEVGEKSPVALAISDQIRQGPS